MYGASKSPFVNHRAIVQDTPSWARNVDRETLIEQQHDNRSTPKLGEFHSVWRKRCFMQIPADVDARYAICWNLQNIRIGRESIAKKARYL